MSNYWDIRTRQRIIKSEAEANKAMNKILPIYEQALQNINKEINSLYTNYADKVGLDVIELTRVLSDLDKENFIKDIHKKMSTLGMDVSDIYDEKYIGRLTRLEAIKQQIYWEIQQIAPQEERISEDAYKKIIQESYQASTYDLREAMGEEYRGFAMIDNAELNEILREKWKGGNYSSRIWGNVGMLNNKIQDILPVVLGGGLTVGTSQEKMARQIRERFDVSRYNSMRLVRTESNYFQNQAELQSYIDEGIEYYEYMAILDNRTSDICEDLDGEVFLVAEAEVGENYPPMHPNCRSGTKVSFEGVDGHDHKEFGEYGSVEEMEEAMSEGYDHKEFEEFGSVKEMEKYIAESNDPILELGNVEEKQRYEKTGTLSHDMPEKSTKGGRNILDGDIDAMFVANSPTGDIIKVQHNKEDSFIAGFVRKENIWGLDYQLEDSHKEAIIKNIMIKPEYQGLDISVRMIKMLFDEYPLLESLYGEAGGEAIGYWKHIGSEVLGELSGDNTVQIKLKREDFYEYLVKKYKDWLS